MKCIQGHYVWILAVVCICSLFLFIGEAFFNTRGEPREAVVALSMLKEENWILPINNGVELAFKPPLFHWMIAAFSTVTGAVTEYTSRMPSALALAVMVLAGYGFYARRRGAEVAFLMGLLTLTNFEMHRAGTNCRVDMVLSALMVLALYQLYRWGEKRLKGVPWLGVLCLSGAFLTKGPVGVLLPCLVVAVFLWIRGMNFWRIFFSFLGIVLLSCVLPACWYVAAYRQGGDRFLQLVLEENVLRFLGKMSYDSHVNPWYYNFITVFAGYVPYTLLVLISLFCLRYRRIQAKPAGWWARLKTYVRNMDDARLFSLLSIAIIFVFYCIPKSKRSVYLLPIYPFIAYFLAEYMIYLVRHHRRVLVSFGGIMGGLSILLFLVFVAVRCGMVPDTVFSGKHAAENIAFMHALEQTSIGLKWIVLLLPLVAVGIFFRMRKKSGWTLLYATVSIVFTLFFALDGFYQPTVLNVKSDKPVADHIATVVPQGRLYSYRTDVYTANRTPPFTINFYLGDRIVPFDVFLPDAGYLVVGESDVEAFREAYPAYEIRQVYDSRHRSCDDHKVVQLYQFRKVGQ